MHSFQKKSLIYKEVSNRYTYVVYRGLLFDFVPKFNKQLFLLLTHKPKIEITKNKVIIKISKHTKNKIKG
jgi:hypothetical protein